MRSGAGVGAAPADMCFDLGILLWANDVQAQLSGTIKTAPGGFEMRLRRHLNPRAQGLTSPPVPLRHKEVKLPVSISGSGASAHVNVPTSVYLYYDKFGVLLYVGITHRGTRRNHEHSKTQGWWRYVARQEVNHLPSREAALRAERELIIQRNPPFNRTHNPGHEALAVAYRQFYAQAQIRERADQEANTQAKTKKVRRPASKVARKVAAEAARKAQPAELPRPRAKGVPLTLDIISRDGKFARCHTRTADAKITATLDLTATDFDRFQVDQKVGSLVSLSRSTADVIEMVLKGSWLNSVTQVVVIARPHDRLIETLQFTIDAESVVATPLGIWDARKVHVGKFSNGPLSRRSSQKGVA